MNGITRRSLPGEIGGENTIGKEEGCTKGRNALFPFCVRRREGGLGVLLETYEGKKENFLL